MAVELALDPLVEEVNLYLNRHQKIHKDDPILANIVVNKVILDKYVKSLHDALQKSHQEISAATVVEVQTAKEVAASMIGKTASHLEEQLINAGTAWETKFREAASDEILKVHLAAKVAYIGAGAFSLAGVIVLAMVLGNLFAVLFKH